MGIWTARRRGEDANCINPLIDDRRAVSRFVPLDGGSPSSRLVMMALDRREFHPAYGTILNLSEVGACVISDTSFDVGREVRLGIGHHPCSSYFLAEGEIIWHRGGILLDGDLDGFIHGVQLARLPESERLKLEQQRKISHKIESCDLTRRKKSHRYWLAMLGLCVPLVVCVAGTSLGVGQWSSVLGERVRTTAAHFDTKTQWLETTMNFETRRQHLVQVVQGEILRANPGLGRADAYRYSELLLESSDKYPSIDPILFLSIGIIESSYNPFATSQADAKGLYQIWPPTGRLLAQELDWNYSDDMLYDPEKNTAMAALYLDMLHSIHKGDVELVLAEYNGGDRNARFYRQKSPRLAAETSEYVVKGKDVYRRIRTNLGLDSETIRRNTDPFRRNADPFLTEDQP